MIYLLGGSGRTGKTNIAKMFFSETGTPYLSLDYLMMGIGKGIPELNIDTGKDDELLIGKLMWPILEPMIAAMVENGVDYFYEGAQLVPEYVYNISQRFEGAIRSCFVGYVNADVQKKSDEIIRFGWTSENDWTSNHSRQELEDEVVRMVNFSLNIKNECEKYNIPYFDASFDFENNVKSIMRYLMAK